MTRLSAPRLFRRRLVALGAAPAALAAPLAAQSGPGSFSLPPGSASPAPAPEGPADERAGVAIPPRPVPTATPSPVPSAAPTPTVTLPPQPAPRAAPAVRIPSPTPERESPPQAGASAPSAAGAEPAATLSPPASALPAPGAVPAPAATGTLPPPASAPSVPIEPADAEPALPDWWPYAAGGLGALLLLGAGGTAWRRRRPQVLRLATPAVATDEADRAPDLRRLDLALEITGATRSVMRFTLAYRLSIANRSDRAVQDVAIAVQLACARASAGSGPSAGAAQKLDQVARIGPRQAHSVSGEVSLPLSAIQPLRQGATPLFVPLLHVTIEGEGQPPLTKTFVVGPRSASGRVHPIALDGPPGSVAGLVAQGVAIPPASAAA